MAFLNVNKINKDCIFKIISVLDISTHLDEKIITWYYLLNPKIGHFPQEKRAHFGWEKLLRA